MHFLSKMAIFVFVSYLLIFSLKPSAAVQENDDKLTAKTGISPAFVPSTHTYAILGLPLNISCFSEDRHPLKLCRWERKPSPNGKRYIVTVRETLHNGTNQFASNNDPHDCNCTYNYIGEGLNKGDCSISIQNVNIFHSGTVWECTLKGHERVWVGSTNITKLVSRPYFQNSLEEGVIYNASHLVNSNVTCCVDMNDPKMSVAINIGWGELIKHNSYQDGIYVIISFQIQLYLLQKKATERKLGQMKKLEFRAVWK